jgi:hypothetical protein
MESIRFEKALLDTLLTVDTVARPRHGLQAGRRDDAATRLADPVGAGFDALERVVDVAPQLALAAGQGQHELPVVGVVRPIDEIVGALVAGARADVEIPLVGGEVLLPLLRELAG